MNPGQRRQFDMRMEKVLEALPATLQKMLDEVPLIVDDHPSREQLDDLGHDPDTVLCGLHTGIPLTRRSVEDSGTLPEAIHLFREGILDMATDDLGRIDPSELENQIRITLLHEIGHHFGLDEEDLRRAGYG